MKQTPSCIKKNWIRTLAELCHLACVQPPLYTGYCHHAFSLFFHVITVAISAGFNKLGYKKGTYVKVNLFEEIAKFGVSITFVLVHMQRKRKQSFHHFVFCVCVNVGQKTVQRLRAHFIRHRGVTGLNLLQNLLQNTHLVNSSFSRFLFVSLEHFGT